ncbi:hypothetical protein HYFRA_00006056 [Hymenoscyphus fraxineus]|uniref:Uncharacterized protein n=1 Tax=Hymenoscyphus fraxineus TaxID=746836 RepID=A0A9N9KVU9_9HELO|nr:hypothetical protein HYFRA_00006056 [Hymenoscyphus fraxineus]
MHFQPLNHILIILLPFTALAIAQSEHIKHHHKKLSYQHHHNSTLTNGTNCHHCNSTATATSIPCYATNATILTNGAGSSFEVKREVVMVGSVVVGAVVLGLGL